MTQEQQKMNEAPANVAKGRVLEYPDEGTGLQEQPQEQPLEQTASKFGNINTISEDEKTTRLYDGLLETINALVSALNKETSLVKEAPSAEVLKEVGLEKQNSLESYDVHISKCGDLKAFIGKLDQPRREKLKEVFLHLSRAMRDNELRLRSALEVSTTLLDCIADAVRDTAPQIETYGREGQIRKSGSAHGGAVTLRTEA